MKIRYLLFISLLLLCLDLSAEQKAKVKIGMLLPLSGQFAAVGSDNQQGIAVAQLEIGNADRMELLFADTKADGAQAVSEFRKMLDSDSIDGAFVFRGPPGMSISPISKSAHIPILGGVGNKDFALNNEYAFQLWSRSDEEGAYVAQKMHERQIKSVALFTVQDDWPVAVSNGFRAKFKELGGVLSFDQDIIPTDSDFRSLIAKVRMKKPDALFVNIGLNQIGPFVKQLRELGVTSTVYSNFWAGKREVLEALGEAGDGLLYAEMATDLGHFKSILKDRFNASPSGATLSAYVATLLFSQAISEMDRASETGHEALYKHLLNQREVRTKIGSFDVKDRFVQFPMTIREVRRGEVR